MRGPWLALAAGLADQLRAAVVEVSAQSQQAEIEQLRQAVEVQAGEIRALQQGATSPTPPPTPSLTVLAYIDKLDKKAEDIRARSVKEDARATTQQNLISDHKINIGQLSQGLADLERYDTERTKQMADLESEHQKLDRLVKNNGHDIENLKASLTSVGNEEFSNVDLVPATTPAPAPTPAALAELAGAASGASKPGATPMPTPAPAPTPGSGYETESLEELSSAASAVKTGTANSSTTGSNASLPDPEMPDTGDSNLDAELLEMKKIIQKAGHRVDVTEGIVDKNAAQLAINEEAVKEEQRELQQQKADSNELDNRMKAEMRKIEESLDKAHKTQKDMKKLKDHFNKMR